MPMDEFGCWTEVGLLGDVEFVAMHFVVFSSIVKICFDPFADFEVIIW